MQGKNSGRGAIAYLAVASVQRGATLLVLPLFALAIAPEEYGQIALLITVYGLVTMLLSAGMEAPLFRSMFSIESPEQRRTYVSTIVTALFLIPSLLGIALGLVISVGPMILGLQPHHLGSYVAIAGIFTSATVGPLALLRAKEQFGSYAFLILAYAGVQLGLRVLLVVVGDMGVSGWLLADLLAAVFVLALSLRWQRPYLSISWLRKKDLRSGLRMGLPLVPHAAAHWTLNLSDRLVLAAFWTPAVVGVYSMGYQIAFVAGMAVMELNRAFMPRYGEATQRPPNRHSLSEHAIHQILATVALTAGVSLLGPQVIHRILPESYSDAAGLIPWVALGFAFFGFYCVPMNLITIVTGKTDGVWLLTIAAGAVNVGANLLLVPRYGPVAAAVNTALGYLVLLVLVGLMARRRCAALHLDLQPIFRIVPTAMALAAGGSLLAVREGAIGGASAVLTAGLVLVVLTFGVRRGTQNVPASLPLAGDSYA